MKAVIFGLCPDATLLDISHEIPPQDILSGALELEAIAPWLPDGTIVLGVVDPGVGSARRGIGIEHRGLRFVGPDNGLFALAVPNVAAARVVELTNPLYRREPMSPTFEGRDRFAPAAAWLARGIALREFGEPVEDLVLLEVPAPKHGVDRLEGTVLRVDRFGNLVTNLARHDLAALGAATSIEVCGVVISELSSTYAERAPGSLCALIGSTERLEVAVVGGSAFATLSAGRGTPVIVRSRQPA
jgi:S-adenosylmethionine hydrolase